MKSKKIIQLGLIIFIVNLLIPISSFANETIPSGTYILAPTSPTSSGPTQSSSLPPKFQALANAIQNQSIISELSEPISNKNIFNKTQICQTKYLLNQYGGFQFVDGTSVDWASQLQAGETEINENIRQNLIREFGTKEVAITIDSCKTYYTATCSPQNTHIRKVKLKDSLPVVITCSVVQLLFADSGVDLLKQYINLIYTWAAGIGGVIAVLVIMLNGIIISIAQGDEGKVTEAKGRIIQSLTALVVLFAAGILLYTINPNYFTTSDLQYTLPPEEIESTEDTSSESSDSSD